MIACRSNHVGVKSNVGVILNSSFSTANCIAISVLWDKVVTLPRLLETRLFELGEAFGKYFSNIIKALSNKWIVQYCTVIIEWLCICLYFWV